MTAKELIAKVADRIGLTVMGPAQYMAHPIDDYWCVQLDSGTWVRINADVFERESDEEIEALLEIDMRSIL